MRVKSDMIILVMVSGSIKSEDRNLGKAMIEVKVKLGQAKKKIC